MDKSRTSAGLWHALLGALGLCFVGAVSASASMISASGVDSPRFGPSVNLTAAGKVDWLHFIDGQHKNATARIAYPNNPPGNALSDTVSTWTDAAPGGTSGSSGGSYYAAYDFTHHLSYTHTITVTAPDTRPYLLTAYLGGFWNGGGFDTLNVSLPGAVPFVDVWNDPSVSGTGTDRTYSINFQANNPGDVLTLTWQADAAGHDLAVIRAAALSVVPEPSSAVLVGIAAVMLCVALRCFTRT
jgi:hypothetical protein